MPGLLAAPSFAPIDVTKLNRPRAVTEEVVVGKDLLELLAGAMYADPLTIYREYIQNSADAIDLVRERGLSTDDPLGVVITLDRTLRSIFIRDNGASIPRREFVRRLTAIGASGKRGKGLRGFRGVGRLSGLGYCQELVFRGRADGDDAVTEVVWDGKRLRDLLRDATYVGDLASLVRGIVEVRVVPPGTYPARFFEVELRKVSRLRGDLLLNDESIRTYLSQVAPVPFHPTFQLGPQISAFLRARGVQEPVAVTFDGDLEPIHHRARDKIAFSEKLFDVVHSVEFLEFLGLDGEVAAFGWLLDHAYLGAVPRRLGLGGIRLRAGNIQVGGEAALGPLFAEPRFASWAIGDIHIASPQIIPNARRDEFEAGVHYAFLQDELTILTKRITQVIRDRSLARKRMRTAQFHLGMADQWLDHAHEGALPVAVSVHVRRIVDAHIKDVQHEIRKLSEAVPEVNALKSHVRNLTVRAARLFHDEEARQVGPRSAQDKAINVALRVILEHASSPQAGLAMSKRVLSAFEIS